MRVKKEEVFPYESDKYWLNDSFDKMGTSLRTVI